MSCEIRSMITAYFFGSSIRIPPIFTNSASTPSTFIPLIFSTNVGGNVLSIPNKIPIFFITNSPLPQLFVIPNRAESPVRNLLLPLLHKLARPTLRPRIIRQRKLNPVTDGRMAVKQENVDRIRFWIRQIHLAQNLKRLRRYLG